MKIVDLQVIPFQVPRQQFHHGEILPETMVKQTITKIVTDQGAEGYYFGGRGHGDMDGMSAEQIEAMQGRIKTLVLGHDPFDREKFWHWLWVAKVDEKHLSQYGFGGGLRGARRRLQSGRLYSLQDSSLLFLGSHQKGIRSRTTFAC